MKTHFILPQLGIKKLKPTTTETGSFYRDAIGSAEKIFKNQLRCLGI